MSQATMDTEPGGENTPYESINTYGKPHAKDQGQFQETTPNEASQPAQPGGASRGEKTAGNIRYGEAISEHGFGGETVGNTGVANPDSGFGGAKRDEGSGEGGQMRREQGYGGGSGVGA